MSIVCLPEGQVDDVACPVTLGTPDMGGDVLLISDGSCQPNALGWGALVVGRGGVLASTCGGFACTGGSSWAAEWLGKLAAVLLALTLGVEAGRW